MAKHSEIKRKYPWKTEIGGTQFTLRLMTADDEDSVIKFARSLPEDDLLFLSFDITKKDFVKKLDSAHRSGELAHGFSRNGRENWSVTAA